MTHTISSVTQLPNSCKSAAERTAAFLKAEDAYASLPENCLEKLSRLEKELSKETHASIALVAYRLS